MTKIYLTNFFALSFTHFPYSPSYFRIAAVFPLLSSAKRLIKNRPAASGGRHNRERARQNGARGDGGRRDAAETGQLCPPIGRASRLRRREYAHCRSGLLSLLAGLSLELLGLRENFADGREGS